MNIGIVTTWFERGAAYVSKQYLDILKARYNIYVYARGGEKYAKNETNWDHDYVTWGEKPKLDISTDIDLEHFGKWIKEKSIDIVFFNEQRWWPAVIYCIENKIVTGSYIDYYTEETIPYFELYNFIICNTKKHMKHLNGL